MGWSNNMVNRINQINNRVVLKVLLKVQIFKQILILTPEYYLLW